MNNKRRNRIEGTIVCIIVLFLVIGSGVMRYYKEGKRIEVLDTFKDKVKDKIEDTIDVVTKPKNKEKEENSEYQPLIDQYNKNKEINEDYIGQLYFDSGLIDLPVVQGRTNDTYMRTDWETMSYDVGGSIFMDASNVIDNDQNVIIYGHNFDLGLDPESTKMFSPLRALMNEDKYEENKYINLFVGDKLLRYEVVATYCVRIFEENGIQYIAENEPVYVITNYTNEEFSDFVSKVKEKQYYETGASVYYSDKILNLQTCIDGEIDKFVVLAKQIEKIDINFW